MLYAFEMDCTSTKLGCAFTSAGFNISSVVKATYAWSTIKVVRGWAEINRSNSVRWINLPSGLFGLQSQQKSCPSSDNSDKSSEVGKNEWREAFERYLNVGDNLSRRLMLKVSVTRKKKKIFSSYALNEATVSSSGTSKVVKLELDLDNTYSGLFKADGIIVATPTGSTGYSLAAGGPILMSDISAFIITPICPFTLSNRPLVTGSETNCTIKVAEGQRTGVVLSVDGQVSIDLEEGDEVNIEKSRSKALLILSHKRNYIEVIRDKLNWSGEMHA